MKEGIDQRRKEGSKKELIKEGRIISSIFIMSMKPIRIDWLSTCSNRSIGN